MADDNDGKLYLILGCNGLESDGFVSCRGTENRILYLNPEFENYSGIMDYMDLLRLFDRPLLDFNAIKNSIYKMQDKFDQRFKKLWTEQKFHIIEKYILTHKQCGLYMNLILSSDIVIEKKEEPLVYIKGEPILKIVK